MQPVRILDEQRITVKRGRMNGLGFEPCFNSFFDFYLSTRYTNPPLLQLEDVTFFLFIRKNINDGNPDWKMPSIKQMKTKFAIGQGKIDAMMRRLHHAKLLVKVSGKRYDSPNVNNEYILSDPISNVEEFLIVLDAGLFDPIPETGIGGVPEMGIALQPELGIGPIPEMGRDQHTSFEQRDITTTAWGNVLGLLKQHLPADTYQLFLADTQLLAIEDSTAVLITPRSSANTWLERQMAPSIRRLLTVELGVKIEGVKVVKDSSVEGQRLG